ncbi:MAG: nucleoside 2-deoxyribosyltransferase [Patescibacteria group bacterium]|nr:nucleoside 2-deoxyribosyltransferase [Patescibacteria group bacterium]
MKVYIAVKFHDDARNRKLIEVVSSALEENGFEPVCFVRDYERYGKVKFSAEEMVEKALAAIKDSDLLVLDLTEKGVGLGIEAGFAHANNIPIITIAKENSDISKTLEGISKRVIFYNNPEELPEKLRGIND